MWISLSFALSCSTLNPNNSQSYSLQTSLTCLLHSCSSNLEINSIFIHRAAWMKNCEIRRRICEKRRGWRDFEMKSNACSEFIEDYIFTENRVRESLFLHRRRKIIIISFPHFVWYSRWLSIWSWYRREVVGRDGENSIFYIETVGCWGFLGYFVSAAAPGWLVGGEKVQSSNSALFNPSSKRSTASAISWSRQNKLQK